jgi:peptidoglycan/xylan/chitin deacetylase (PgdA/CDA1 family)
MQRRSFVKTTILGSLAVGLSSYTSMEKTHIITLSFDDGYKKSFYKIADIFEEYDLRSCLNVIASGHFPGFQSPSNSISPKLLGNFDDWNSLQRRGHEIMPHSWNHRNLTQLPLEQAKEDITKCLDYFEEHLEGFKTSNAVYNFAYNASTPELEKFALSNVRAIRTQRNSPVNPISNLSQPVRLGCGSFGPGNAGHWVDQQVNEFFASSGGWLILNLHGLDDEGWGPISSKYLKDLLKRLIKIDFLEILAAAEVLKRSAT